MYYMVFFFYFFINLQGKELFYIKFSSKRQDGYLADDPANAVITIAKDKSAAKKFWVTIDPNDPFRAMIHCNVGGQDVVTRINNHNFRYLPKAERSANAQYWIVGYSWELRGDKPFYFYTFSNDLYFWTYNKTNVFLTYGSTSSDWTVFEIVHMNGDEYYNPFILKTAENNNETGEKIPDANASAESNADAGVDGNASAGVNGGASAGVDGNASAGVNGGAGVDGGAGAIMGAGAGVGGGAGMGAGMGAGAGINAGAGMGAGAGFENSASGNASHNASGNASHSVSGGGSQSMNFGKDLSLGYGGGGLLSGYSKAVFDAIKIDNERECSKKYNELKSEFMNKFGKTGCPVESCMKDQH
ncbi:hypothetical protein GVAV_002075 [Gurleya vavrai]